MVRIVPLLLNWPKMKKVRVTPFACTGTFYILYGPVGRTKGFRSQSSKGLSPDIGYIFDNLYGKLYQESTYLRKNFRSSVQKFFVIPPHIIYLIEKERARISALAMFSYTLYQKYTHFSSNIKITSVLRVFRAIQVALTLANFGILACLSTSTIWSLSASKLKYHFLPTILPCTPEGTSGQGIEDDFCT